MAESKEDKIAIVSEMLQNHTTLLPELFDPNAHMFPHVRRHLLNVAEIFKQRIVNLYPNAKIKDIILLGSTCSYAYSQNSDLDLFLVIEGFESTPLSIQKIIPRTNLYLFKLCWRPYIYGRHMDIGLIVPDEARAHGINDYSVLRDEWNHKPLRQEYPFTPEELFKAYCRYSADLHKFVASLEKINDAFLTSDSCDLLDTKLSDINNNAFKAKKKHPLHEYCMEYNLYRLLKRFGTSRHFYNYIRDSQKYILSSQNDI